MSKAFLKLFQPVQIGRVMIKNRIAMAPIGIFGLINPDGSLTQRAIDYYVERAKGGVGLIITSIAKVENEIDPIDLRLFNALMINPAIMYPLAELCGSVHSFGTKIFVQLTAGIGRVASPSVVRGQPVSASAIPNYWNPNITCRALTTEEVDKM